MAIGAVLLDRVLGEPRRFHPLVGFGRLAEVLEKNWNPRGATAPRAERARGMLALALLVLPFAALAAMAASLPEAGTVLQTFILFLAIGGKSLADHGLRVQAALDAGSLEQARAQVGRMVSRDTGTMEEQDVARAAVESVLENGNDAVFGPLFWFVVAGAPGVVVYRLVNTLDAMWGYRTPRFFHFGWAAARLDDGLNFIPARLTALSYALLGQLRRALRCWRRQAAAWDGVNPGVVMATGAGALGLALGGPAVYHGRQEQRPRLGEGAAPSARDIGRALRLVRQSLWLWLGVLALGGWILA